MRMKLHDGPWHERMYDNRALVPGYAEFFQRWARESAQARAQGPCSVDLRYGDGPGETLDVFPAPQGDAPVLVFVHGGYWRALDKSDHSFIAPAFTRDGACVVVPNYPLCPAVTIPDITLQVARAVAWTWAFDTPFKWTKQVASHFGGTRQGMAICWPNRSG